MIAVVTKSQHCHCIQLTMALEKASVSLETATHGADHAAGRPTQRVSRD
jgi:hypothetical protein